VVEMSGVIRPGRVWLDTKGERIQAHGGSVLFADGTFYWYGENKERSTGRDGIWHWGVRCYASTDLSSWEDLGLIIPPVLDDPRSPLNPAQFTDRPHIVINPETGKYICWLRVSSRAGRPQTLVVLVADALLGPYRIVEAGLRPLGMDAGDFDLVIDSDDGKALLLLRAGPSGTGVRRPDGGLHRVHGLLLHPLSPTRAAVGTGGAGTLHTSWPPLPNHLG